MVHALSEALGSIFSTTWQLTNICRSGSRESDPIFWPLPVADIWTHKIIRRHSTRTYKGKMVLNIKKFGPTTILQAYGRKRVGYG